MAKPAAFGGTELQLDLVNAELKERGLTNAVLTTGRVAKGREFSMTHLPMGHVCGERLLSYS